MVSKLIPFERDPMHASHPEFDRGRGKYYNRGHLRGFKHDRNGDYWSKYSEDIDGKKPHLPKKTTNIPKSEEYQPHKGDYRTRKARNGRVDLTRKTTRLSTTTKRGFF